MYDSLDAIKEAFPAEWEQFTHGNDTTDGKLESALMDYYVEMNPEDIPHGTLTGKDGDLMDYVINQLDKEGVFDHGN
jgi:hypothetical protein|tara:strand:+ start:180 stop:410 length:231 start_codon:yes stop_codon:yes gene_type:complete